MNIDFLVIVHVDKQRMDAPCTLAGFNVNIGWISNGSLEFLSTNL